MANSSFQLKSEVANKAKTILLGIAVLGWVGTIIAFVSNKDQAFSAYLSSFVYWVSLSIGATFFVMLQRLTQAEWSVVVRRIAETVMTNFWVLAILFIPILFGLHSLYEWTHLDNPDDGCKRHITIKTHHIISIRNLFHLHTLHIQSS